MATTQNIDFSNTQGQITPQSEVGSGRNSNSSKMLWMYFFTQSRTDNSVVKGRNWLKFELIGDVITILVTSKYEEDPIKIEGARVATTQNIDFSNNQGQLTPQSEVVSS